MKVHWTNNAIKHLKGIKRYIAQNSPEYANRIVDRLTKRSQQIVEGLYRIIYYIKPDQIDVLAVIHGADDFPWTE